MSRVNNAFKALVNAAKGKRDGGDGTGKDHKRSASAPKVKSRSRGESVGLVAFFGKKNALVRQNPSPRSAPPTTCSSPPPPPRASPPPPRAASPPPPKPTSVGTEPQASFVSDPSSAVSSCPWALALVVVRFDLEVGQVVDKVVPEGALTKEQEKEMCYLGFPDSNARVTRDTTYVIKPYRSRNPSAFNYGYVYFRQKKDPGVPRGYVQHSVILLSRWPFCSLLEQVVIRVATAYFSHCPVSPTPFPTSPLPQSSDGSLTYTALGATPLSNSSDRWPTGSPLDLFSASCSITAGVAVLCVAGASFPSHLEKHYRILQDALLDIQQWSYPEANGEYVFRLLGEEIAWKAPKFYVTSRVTTANASCYEAVDPLIQRRLGDDLRLRNAASNRHQSSESRLLERLSGTRYIFGEMPLYSVFRTQLRRLWAVWELMLLGEPLCILSQQPAVSSTATLGAVSLIHPITYCGDFRPYFAVQDPDFKRFCSFGKDHRFPEGGGPCVGVTNPYFTKALAKWPHLITIHDHSMPGGVEAKVARDKDLNKRMGRRAGRTKSKREQLLWEFKETFITTRHFVVDDSTDKVEALASQMLHGKPEDATVVKVNSDIIRRHFMQLTDHFLQPLVRCFDSIWESVKLPLIVRCSNCELFEPALFKQYVREHGYVKGIFKRGSNAVHNMYDRFIDGVNFPNWVEEQIQEKYRAELATVNMEDLVKSRSEVQRIDLCLKLMQDLNEERGKPIRDTCVMDLLDSHIAVLLRSIPEHLRMPLLRNVNRTSPECTLSPRMVALPPGSPSCTPRTLPSEVASGSLPPDEAEGGFPLPEPTEELVEQWLRGTEAAEREDLLGPSAVSAALACAALNSSPS